MDRRSFRSLAPSVPIVGAPKICEWRPIVTMLCSCGHGDPLLITAVDRAARCGGCGRVFALAALHFDASKGPNANIGVADVTARTDAPQNGAAPPPVGD